MTNIFFDLTLRTYILVLSVKIGFLWPQNTLAVVEEEKSSTYETFQYIIQENWHLTISRSDRKDIKWEVKRRTSEGGLEILIGKRRSFSIAKEKAFKVMPNDDERGEMAM